MINLIAESVLSTGALVGIIIGGVVVLGVAIFGIVLAARGKSLKFDRRKKGIEPILAPIVVDEKPEDFSNLTNAEKDLLRIYRGTNK